MNEAQKQNYRGSEAALDWSAEVCAPGGEGSAARLEAKKQGIAAGFIREAAAGWAACGAFEWGARADLVVSGALIAMFAKNLAHPLTLFGGQALGAAAIFGLCENGAPGSGHTNWRRQH